MSKITICVGLMCFLFIACGSREGLFGHSKTKEEAVANGSTVFEYVPDKIEFNLLDGTKLRLDTAWTEISFTYKGGKRIMDSTHGYHFSIPFKKERTGTFIFSLDLADTANRAFTNGMDENLVQICPRNLHDKMKVLLEQKNIDTLIGWKLPIITDTITFTKLGR